MAEETETQEPDSEAVAPASDGYAEIRIWEGLHEPSAPIHDVFSVAIPNAFGVPFLRRLVALA